MSVMTYNLGALKREARRRVNTNLAPSLSKALDRIAIENGYADWPTLVRKIETPIMPAAVTSNEGPGT